MKAAITFYLFVLDENNAEEMVKTYEQITRHLLDIGYQIDRKIYLCILAQPHNTQRLRVMEAVLIRRLNPDLCTRQDFASQLRLAW